MEGADPNAANPVVAEAVRRVYAATRPGSEELRLMLLLEASGRTAYEEIAQLIPLREAADLVRRNAREEIAHAHRIAKVLQILHGLDAKVPSVADNPFIRPFGDRQVTPEKLRDMAVSERRGEALYRLWSANEPNLEAAELYAQNGREEAGHSDRLERAASLLAGSAN